MTFRGADLEAPLGADDHLGEGPPVLGVLLDEFANEDPRYPLKYSTYAYEMGANMIVYAMSH